jgi:hypothetical protein
MKRFWFVLLSLGLLMAFSASAFAVDVKVGAEYYVGGLYLDKTSVNAGYSYHPYDNPSTAFFFQRLRVGTDFIVSPSLKLVTRFDALERIWGGGRSDVDYDNPGYVGTWANYTNWSAGTRAEKENIAFDVMYIDYTSPIGLFRVGYMPDYNFGTDFADEGNRLYNGQIEYIIKKGPFIGGLSYSKVSEKNWSYLPASTSLVDTDYDSYRVFGIYEFNTAKAKGEAGVLFLYDRNATNKANYHHPYMQNVYVIDPYVKAKIGPVDLQAEALYYWGDAIKWEDNVPAGDVSISAWSAFVDATATFGPVYVGGTFAYLSGDNPGTNDKLEGSGAFGPVNTAGANYNPCLILFNTETLGYWVGDIDGHTNSIVNNQMSNALFFQGRVGVKPTPQWDILLAVSYAVADQKPANPYNPFTGRTYANGTYGTEVDLTATYKITNNLSYMIGGGYLFTGDYFKGFDRAGQGYEIDDDYMLINKLTLSF